MRWHKRSRIFRVASMEVRRVEQKSKRTQPSYSMWQNINYVLKNLWIFERKLFLMATARVPLLVVLPLLAILMPKLVLDCLTAKVGPGRLVEVVGLVSLGMIVCSFLNQYFNGRISIEVVSNRAHYVSLISQKTLNTDYENLENPEGQKKQQKAFEATSDANKGTEAVLIPLILFAADIFGFVLYGGILAALNPLIIVFLLATAVLSFFVTRRVQQYEHNNKDNWTLIDRKLWYLIDRCADFAAGKDIRLYNMSGWFGRLFETLLNDRTVWLKRVERRNYLANTVDGLLILVRDGAAYAYLVYLTLTGSISVADFTLYFGTVAGFSTWLTGITDELTQLNHMSLDICNVRDYLDLRDRFNRGKGVSLPAMGDWPCEVEFEHISFQYPGSAKRVVDDFSLKIRRGEKIALVGVNGAGKTTLVKLLCGLYHPTSGRILANGKDMLDYNRDEYYRLFSAVFQDIHMLPVSIARNVATEADGPIVTEKVLQCLKLAGLEEKVNGLPKGIETPLVKEVNEDAVQLSGGELQKLVLARALYKDTPILILDEPTAALDPISENELYVRYSELTAGRTSVFISHRLSSTRFCDRIVFLSNGKIAECGTHEELMTQNKRYAEMFRIQSHYYQDHVEEMEWEGVLSENR